MDLYEYQARDLFQAHGVPVLPGRVVMTSEQAGAAAAELGGTVVVKAQVKTGGRGKAGGVQLAATPQEAQRKAAAILGMDIKGHTVHSVLVTPACDIAQEYYLSFILDRTRRTFLAMASVQGGMDIEEVAATAPQALDLLDKEPSRGDATAKPLVVRLDGNNATEGRRIIAQAAHPMIMMVDTMDVAADKAAELAALTCAKGA